MKLHLTAVRRPMLAANMTRAELVREAEHTFINPSPLIRRMIEELRGDRFLRRRDLPVAPHTACDEGQCPACGAPINIEIQS